MIRDSIADFLAALILVYVILIIAYILLNLAFSFGLRPGYNRAFGALVQFLRDTVEPYLRIFRRFIPPLGPLDLSPIVAILVLQIVGGLVVAIIRG